MADGLGQCAVVFKIHFLILFYCKSDTVQMFRTDRDYITDH